MSFRVSGVCLVFVCLCEMSGVRASVSVCVVSSLFSVRDLSIIFVASMMCVACAGCVVSVVRVPAQTELHDSPSI